MDPRLLRRCYSSDSSKPEFSCETENKVGRKEVTMDVSTEQPENFESCIEPTYECSELASQISGSLSYDCGTPETHRRSDLASSSGSQVPFLLEAGETGQLGERGPLEEARSKESIGTDWEMISDAADFLIFESPNNAEGIMAPCQKLTGSITRFCALVTRDDIDNIQNTEPVGPVEIEQSVHNHPSQSGDNHHIADPTSPNKYVMEENSEQVDNELASSFQRGGRRRCLTFDMSGIHKRNLNQFSNSGSAILSKSDASNATNSTKSLPMKLVNSSSSFCILPGIGLHLNAIARTSKDNVVSQETVVKKQSSIIKKVGKNMLPLLNKTLRLMKAEFIAQMVLVKLLH